MALDGWQRCPVHFTTRSQSSEGQITSHLLSWSFARSLKANHCFERIALVWCRADKPKRYAGAKYSLICMCSGLQNNRTVVFQEVLALNADRIQIWYHHSNLNDCYLVQQQNPDWIASCSTLPFNLDWKESLHIWRMSYRSSLINVWRNFMVCHDLHDMMYMIYAMVCHDLHDICPVFLHVTNFRERGWVVNI